mgnify:CR=1 FL=1
MKKNESSLYISEVKQNEKDGFRTSNTGITKRLLEKYKSKNDFKVIKGAKEVKEVDIAA